jgi:hypothetical protein
MDPDFGHTITIKASIGFYMNKNTSGKCKRFSACSIEPIKKTIDTYIRAKCISGGNPNPGKGGIIGSIAGTTVTV